MKEFFFLLAGGYGKRTEPLSFFKPKPAFPLDGTPLIQIMLDQLACLGLKQGFINLHHLADKIRQITDAKQAEGIVYLPEERLSGNRILNHASEKMAANDLLLVINGDIFLELPYHSMRAKLLKNKADGLLLVRPFPVANNVSYRPLQLHQERFVCRTNKGDFMYTGAALFTKKVLQQITEINFFDTLEANSFHISVLPYTGIWLDIGDIPSYIEANFAYKHYCNEKMPEKKSVPCGKREKIVEKIVGRKKEEVTDLQSNSLSPGVSISPDSQVTDSIIWENTTIQNHSHLHNCIIINNLCLNAAQQENTIITTIL